MSTEIATQVVNAVFGGELATLKKTAVALAAVWYVKNRFFKASHDHHYVHRPVPKGTFKLLGQKEEPTLDEVDQLCAEMRQSFNSGISKPVKTRIQQIKQLRKLFTENEADILAALVTDLGRPKFEGLYYDVLLPISEIDHTLAHLEEWVAPTKAGFNLLTFPSTNEIYQEPNGVALVIGTWNFPIMLSLVPVLGALAAGCCVVLKPCQVASASGKLMARLIPKYLNPEIVTVVGTAMKGDRHTTAALLKNKFDTIFFTGSPSVGKVIARGAAEHLTPCILELGGKNPVVLTKDANIELAAKRIFWARNLNAGQQCIAPDFVLLPKALIPKFIEVCKKYNEEFYQGNTKESPDLGRIVGDRQMERIVGLLKHHKDEIVLGGDYDEATRYIQPTIIQTTLDSEGMKEETFGPILWLVPVEEVQEAIDFINSRPKPLSLYIFSNNDKETKQIIHNTSAGGVTVNACLFHVAHGELPFGGIGESGMGQYHGRASFDCFSHGKAVLTKSIWPDFGAISDPFFLYPPFSNFKETVVRTAMKFV